jgi:hypothetical protein
VLRPRSLQLATRKTMSIGNIIPSDIAFVDVALEKQGFASSTCSSLFDVKNIRLSQTSGHELSITHTHELLYRGEPIFSFETTTNCDGTMILGQSSSCVLVNGKLKIKISTKAKSARCVAGASENFRETKVYSLVELVKLSSKARQNEMMQD